MAQTQAKLAKYSGSRDVWGGHGIFLANYTGTNPYVNSGTFATSGEIIDAVGGLAGLAAANTPLRTIDFIPSSLSISGTYIIHYAPTAFEPVKRWLAHWYVIATGAEVANAVDLSAEKAIVLIIGG